MKLILGGLATALAFIAIAPAAQAQPYRHGWRHHSWHRHHHWYRHSHWRHHHGRRY